ncbi:MAG: hypothetical protein N3A61_03815 [Ignavibacteria bacterium]|nr:hypothetical protein [Ignavibacteria bacterium]
MSYKFRNALILFFLFLLILLSIGYVVFIRKPATLKEKQEKLTQLTQQVSDIESLDKILDSLKKEIQQINLTLSKSRKTIAYREPINDTYAHLISITRFFSPRTIADIEYDKTDTLGNIAIDRFSIKGYGEFDDLYRMIFSLERSKFLYKIKNLNLRGGTTTNKAGKVEHQLNFDFKVESYFSTNKTAGYVKSDAAFKNFQTITNFFRPLIVPDLPPNENNLLEVDGAVVLAIFPDGVLIKDKSGNSYNLTEGDEVYLGYLTLIDSDNQQCEFLLNKGGIIEKVILRLEEKSKSAK